MKNNKNKKFYIYKKIINKYIKLNKLNKKIILILTKIL
jgi:hypothetical protein